MSVTDEAARLLAEYDAAWAALGSSTAVAAKMQFTPGERFEIAAWRLAGAIRIVTARRAGRRL